MVENFISEMSAEDLLRFLRLLVVEGLSMEDSQAPDSQALFSTECIVFPWKAVEMPADSMDEVGARSSFCVSRFSLLTTCDVC